MLVDAAEEAGKACMAQLCEKLFVIWFRTKMAVSSDCIRASRFVANIGVDFIEGSKLQSGIVVLGSLWSQRAMSDVAMSDQAP